MARHYGSFLIRCWTLDGGESRVDVEHIQSGDRTQVSSLSAGLAWIEARAGLSDRANRADAAEPRKVGREVTQEHDQ